MKIDAAMVGAARHERIEHDLYETPRWCVEALLRAWRPHPVVWEPAAGRGAMLGPLCDAGHTVYASDAYDHGEKDIYIRDFLTDGLPLDVMPYPFSVITNPPYKDDLPYQFAHRALVATADKAGSVAMLMRHEWECAANRDGLLDEEPFAGMLTLTRRPRWIAGSTGSPRHNYVWFIWDWRHRGPAFHLRGR